MYKVIIADDEDLIRECLRTYVDWENMGFTIAGTAPDGNKAFDLAQKVKPHVVLTDIKMPFCSGIHLMDRLRKSGMDVRILVLSGYDEFEYAQAAIEAGAVGYLLKPIKFDKLKDVMLKLKHDFDIHIYEQIRKNQASVLLCEQFLRKLVNGAFGIGEELHKEAASLGIRLDWRQFSVLVLDLEGGWLQRYKAEERELPLFTMKNVAGEICGRLGAAYGFQTGDNSVGVLVCGQAYSHDELKQTAGELKRTVENFLKMRVAVSLSGIGSGLSHIPDGFRTALRMLDRKFFVGSHVPLSTDNAGCLCTPAEESRKTLNADRLAFLVQSMDGEAVDDFIEAHFRELPTKDAVYDLLYQFMRFAEKYMEKSDIRLPDAVDGSLLHHPDISRKETLADVVAGVKQIFAAVIDGLEANRHKQGNRLIDEIKKMVETHYAEDLSLDSVAQRVHIHPIYLSRVFKRETGKNFIDYVTELRIKQAKRLFKNVSLKTYEISEMVGYKNARHFSKVFKNLNGITPKEYRKIVLGYVDDLTDA